MITNTVRNVQPTQNLAPKNFPFSPHCKEELQSLKEILFQYPYLDDTE